MLMPDHEFLKPGTLAEGLALLAGQPAARVLAGGTDVVFNMRGRLFTPPAVLSIRQLPELQGLRELPDGSLDIGAGCRLTDLLSDPLVQRHPALLAALRAVASRHVRNMATLGGNLCLDTRCWFTNQSADWRAARGPCLKTGVDVCHAIHGSPVCVALNNADTPPALIALDAVVTLASVRGERQLPLRDFYRNDGIDHTVRASDELLTRVLVPPTTDRMVFVKETARQGMDFAYGTIAARADGHGTQAGRVTLVLGSLTTAPRVLDDIAATLVADGLGDAAIDAACAGLRAALGPLTNLYSPAAYKRELARALLRRALLALREM
jgi:4-hydroxybenzoyl-CoA reductase subunit beta